MVPVLCCVRVRQSVSVAIRADADERYSQSQKTQEKRHSWRILRYIISKIGQRLPVSHHGTSHTPRICAVFSDHVTSFDKVQKYLSFSKVNTPSFDI